MEIMFYMEQLQNKIDTFAENMFSDEQNFKPFLDIDFDGILRKELFEYGLYILSQSGMQTIEDNVYELLEDVFQGDLPKEMVEQTIAQPLDVTQATFTIAAYMQAMKNLYEVCTSQSGEAIKEEYMNLLDAFKNALTAVANVQIENDAYQARVQEILK